MEFKKAMIGTGLTAMIMIGASASAQATVITLDFEGVGDQASINDFYNGGTDSVGNSGVNYGINFSTDTLGLIDFDAGGTGNFANEPSASTAMFFLNASNGILNMAAGFDTGFSFFYSSASTASVNVYDGLNATGGLLGTLSLAVNFNNNGCVGDPAGAFCHWDAIGVTFSGIAKSIDFGGAANSTAFDNITFGSASAKTGAGGRSSLPEPAPLALLGLGLLGLGLARKRRR